MPRTTSSGSGPKRTGSVRDRMVLSSRSPRDVSRMKCVPACGSSSVLSIAFAALGFSSSARRTMKTRARPSCGA